MAAVSSTMRRRISSWALAAAACGALLLGGCATPETRISENPGIFQGLSPSDRALVQRGEIRPGLSQGGVYLALRRILWFWTLRRRLSLLSALWAALLWMGLRSFRPIRLWRDPDRPLSLQDDFVPKRTRRRLPIPDASRRLLTRKGGPMRFFDGQ